MKVSSGRTFYDQIVMSSLEDAVKSHGVSLAGNDSERAMEREDQEQQKRMHAILMQQCLADRVDARASAYERQAEAEV